MEDDRREGELNFGALNSIQEKFDGLTICHHGHGMQASVIKSITIKYGHVITTAGGNVAILPDLAIIAPATFSSHISKENVIGLGFIQDP